MSGIWWDDEDYPNLKKKFDEAQVLIIGQKRKKVTQAAALDFLIDFYEEAIRMTGEPFRMPVLDWDFSIEELAGIVEGLNQGAYLDVAVECDDDTKPMAVLIHWKQLVHKVVDMAELETRKAARHFFPKACYAYADIIDTCEAWGIKLQGENQYYWVLAESKKGMEGQYA